MVVDLGPSPAEDAMAWSKFARRVMVELRSDPGNDRWVADDLVSMWSTTVDGWLDEAVRCQDQQRPFRWSEEMEPEVAEFLLDGLDRCLRSPILRDVCTPAELRRQRPFTVLVVRGFVESLAAEGKGCKHYTDQIETSLAGLLAD